MYIPGQPVAFYAEIRHAMPTRIHPKAIELLNQFAAFIDHFASDKLAGSVLIENVEASCKPLNNDYDYELFQQL